MEARKASNAILRLKSRLSDIITAVNNANTELDVAARRLIEQRKVYKEELEEVVDHVFNKVTSSLSRLHVENDND